MGEDHELRQYTSLFPSSSLMIKRHFHSCSFSTLSFHVKYLSCFSPFFLQHSKLVSLELCGWDPIAYSIIPEPEASLRRFEQISRRHDLIFFPSILSCSFFFIFLFGVVYTHTDYTGAVQGETFPWWRHLYQRVRTYPHSLLLDGWTFVSKERPVNMLHSNKFSFTFMNLLSSFAYSLLFCTWSLFPPSSFPSLRPKPSTNTNAPLSVKGRKNRKQEMNGIYRVIHQRDREGGATNKTDCFSFSTEPPPYISSFLEAPFPF